MRFPRRMRKELQRHSGPPRVAANGAVWLPVPGWNEHWIWAGFSTRKGGLSRAWCAEGAPGELNLGLSREENLEITLANRRLFVEAVTGDPETPLSTLRQIHSKHLVMARGEQGAAKGDGLLAAQPGLLAAVQTADCIPVLVADRRKKAVASFHAGWRGTARRIAEAGIGRMRLEFGSRPEDLIAAIGPGIGACCYAVGEEVLCEFESQFAYANELFHEVEDADPIRRKYPLLFLSQRAPGHLSMGPSVHLDLAEANRRQLLDAGLGAEAIQVLGGCTACRPDLFFSHRASQGHAGRMMAVVGIRPGKNKRGS